MPRPARDPKTLEEPPATLEWAGLSSVFVSNDVTQRAPGASGASGEGAAASYGESAVAPCKWLYQASDPYPLASAEHPDKSVAALQATGAQAPVVIPHKWDARTRAMAWEMAQRQSFWGLVRDGCGRSLDALLDGSRRWLSTGVALFAGQLRVRRGSLPSLPYPRPRRPGRVLKRARAADFHHDPAFHDAVSRQARVAAIIAIGLQQHKCRGDVLFPELDHPLMDAGAIRRTMPEGYAGRVKP